MLTLISALGKHSIDKRQSMAEGNLERERERGEREKEREGEEEGMRD